MIKNERIEYKEIPLNLPVEVEVGPEIDHENSIAKGLIAIAVAAVALPIIGFLGFLATLGVATQLPPEFLGPTLGVATGIGGLGLYKVTRYIAQFFG